jgi:hypothetical protein
MLLQPGLQGGASAMEAYHRVVRGDAELGGDLTDSHAIDDDAPEDLRMLGLQPVHLNKDAPAVECRAVFDGSNLELVDRVHDLAPPTQLIHHQVAHEAAQPRVDSRRVTNLLSSFEGSLERHLQHFFGIESTGSLAANHGQQLLSLRHQSRTDPAGVGKRLDHPLRVGPDCRSFNPSAIEA